MMIVNIFLEIDNTIKSSPIILNELLRTQRVVALWGKNKNSLRVRNQNRH